MPNKGKIVRLDDWFVWGGGEAFTAPELRYPRLGGVVTGHPEHENGKVVLVSDPVSFTRGILTTKGGTRYRLGHPKADYEAFFPGAKKRLQAILRKLNVDAHRFN